MKIAYAMAGALVLAAPAAAVTDFRTSDRAVYCAVVEAYETPRSYIPPLTCWRPRNGFTVFLRARRGASVTLNLRNKGFDGLAVRVLRIGDRWWATRERSGIGAGPRHGVVYRCVNRPRGLRCTNRRNRGFWLGRERGYRLF